MSAELEAARELIAEGDEKAAIQALWKVEAKARGDLDEAKGLVEAANQLKDSPDRKVRRDAELLYGYGLGYVNDLERAGATSSQAGPDQAGQVPVSGSAMQPAAQIRVVRQLEPWFYWAADMVAVVAIIAAVLSVIGGLVIGIEVSKYHTEGLFGTETHHHGGVVAYWIAIGVFTAAVWLALGVGLKLLADVGESLRAMAAAAKAVGRKPDSG